MKRKRTATKHDEDVIKKFARLLPGETLSKDNLDLYRRHKQPKKRYDRLKYTVNYVNEQWEIDLAEMIDLARYNNQYRYWLVCIDVYSRYCWVKLLKKKSSRNVANKFNSILNSVDEFPKKIQCDEGGEFQNIKNNLSKEYGFEVFHTYNREIKASHVERLIQTLKVMVRRVLTMTGEFDYQKYLDIIVTRYNNSPHKSLHGETPASIFKGTKKLSKIKELQKLTNNPKPTPNIFHKNDKVRLARIKNNIFEKASLRRWTDEIFVVHKVFITQPVTYELKDEKGEKIKGIFYYEELQKV